MIVGPPRDGVAARQLNGHVVDGDLDALGFLSMHGRHPERAGEVSLGVTTAEDYGVGIGDSIELTVLGQTLTFEVTGIFQGSSNGGNWYRMTVESFRLVDPTYEPEKIAVILAPGTDRQLFMHEIEAQLGEAVDLEPAEKFVEAQAGQLVRGVGMVVAFLSVVFLVVSAVSIFNSTTMGIHESKRHLGVFKALGYTQGQIRMILVSKSAILAVVAIAFGLISFWLFAVPIMNRLTSQIGMPEFPMLVQSTWTSMVIPLIIGLCMVSAWIPSNRIANITARTLIVE
jgi:putative ABC transport system permease protein